MDKNNNLIELNISEKSENKLPQCKLTFSTSSAPISPVRENLMAFIHDNKLHKFTLKDLFR